VARQFRLAADLLETQDADPFRVSAYRKAASYVESRDESLADVYRDEGVDGLIAMPTIGRALAVAIADMVESGQWRWLERLEGTTDVEALLATVAGIGPGLAARIHHELGIESLEELELAAYDGRLGALAGFGPKRVQSVADSLAGRFQRGGRLRSTSFTRRHEPSTQELFDIDSEYRRKAAAGALPTIAPRRFNPDHERWLPILHTTRGDRHYTAVYSNTARAHRLGRTRDWVVIYADGPEQGQWTMVTETSGPQAGTRVVRGRERASSSSSGRHSP
jgi:hypothetical protein